MYDAILFDLDGTLIDSRADIARCANHTLRNLGLREKTQEEIISYVGNGMFKLIESFLGDENKDMYDDALRIFRDYMPERDRHFQATLYPGVKELLGHLYERDDKDLYVVTNRPSQSAIDTLCRLDICDCFINVVGGDDVESLKPNPSVLDKVLEGRHYDMDKILMIGDMTVDLEFAQKTGIRSCAVSYGFSDNKKLKDMNPDYFIDDILDLKRIIN